MGASPDGLVQCKCCGNGLLEIKCTYTHKDLSPEEVATMDKNYFVYMDDSNNVKLKTNTSWYYQIQTQLGVCDRKWCDFVLYTQKGISVDRISFDNTLFEMIAIASNSNFVFNKYVIPALKKSTNEILKHNNLNFVLSYNFVFRFVNFYKNAKIYYNSNL